MNFHSEPRLQPYRFTNPSAYLRAVYEQKRRHNPKFSIRSWSKQLKLDGHISLWRILQGKRTIGPRLAQRIADRLSLDSRESKFFIALSATARAGVSLLEALDAKEADSVEMPSIRLSEDQIRFIADWWHFAILEMIALKGFRTNPHWISENLGGAITADQCKDALERLERLHLTRSDSSGRIRRTSDANVRMGAIGTGTPSQSLRKFHAQMISKALDAIEGQNSEARFLLGSTIAICKSDLPEVKKLLIETHFKIAKLSRVSDAEEVYHLTTPLFRLAADSERDTHET